MLFSQYLARVSIFVVIASSMLLSFRLHFYVNHLEMWLFNVLRIANGFICVLSFFFLLILLFQDFNRIRNQLIHEMNKSRLVKNTNAHKFTMQKQYFFAILLHLSWRGQYIYVHNIEWMRWLQNDIRFA